ncbi:MAG: hypothetical protein AB8B81_13020 [Halioglobus sp.]
MSRSTLKGSSSAVLVLSLIIASCTSAQDSLPDPTGEERPEPRWWQDEDGKGFFEGEWWKKDKDKNKEKDKEASSETSENQTANSGSKAPSRKGYTTLRNPGSKDSWDMYNSQVIKVGDGFKKMYWGDPTVLKEGDTFRMWFTGGNFKGLNHVRVYTATSKDGIKWKINTKPVLSEGESGSWDDERTETPSVIKVGKTYHMYYTGFKTGDAISRFNIGHATSKDGIKWKKDRNNPVISNHDDIANWGFYYTGEPGVVFNPKDKLFYLYYGTARANYDYKGKNSDLQSTSAIVLATSKNGSKFKLYDRDGDGKQDAVFEPGSYYSTAKDFRGYSTPHALIGSDGKFHLFTDAINAKKGWKQAALVHSVSDDGKSFSTVSNDIVTRGNAKWIAREVIGPTVIEEDGEFLMWFGGHGHDYTKDFGISFARKTLD